VGSGDQPPKVVIVHDYVTQRGGAERVTLDLLRAFPGARLVTSCWNRNESFPEFAKFRVETLWPNKLQALRNDPRLAFPVLASAFERHTIADADIVICSSSGWSHRVRTTAPKIIYCHNPARWLYQPDDYFGAMSPGARRLFRVATTRLRRSDARAASTAARYLVNSTVVAKRVRDTYGLEATVLPPARGLSADGPSERVVGIEPGYLLTVGRARGYKNTEAVRLAVAGMPDERLVVVGGDATEAAPGITQLSGVSDAQMRWLYSNAAGLVAVANEDFGLTAVEAQHFGLPAVLLRRGGYLDSAVENVTGVFVDALTPDAIADGIRQLRNRGWDRDLMERCGERYSFGAFADRIRDCVLRFSAASGGQARAASLIDRVESAQRVTSAGALTG
jgi:glycosyltransferase involved in cell wall biosynthesis